MEKHVQLILISLRQSTMTFCIIHIHICFPLVCGTQKEQEHSKQELKCFDSSRILESCPIFAYSRCRQWVPCTGCREITVCPASVEYKNYRRRLSSYRHLSFDSDSLQASMLAQDGFYFEYSEQGARLTCFSCQASWTLPEMERAQGNRHHLECDFRPPHIRQPQGSEDESVAPIDLSSGYTYQELFYGSDRVPYDPYAATIDRRRSTRHRNLFGDMNPQPDADTLRTTLGVRICEHRKSMDVHGMPSRRCRRRDGEDTEDTSRDLHPTGPSREQQDILPGSSDETGLSDAVGGCELSDPEEDLD
ncbi:unnamed protein product [Lymnaea stagnalis]|uniref:Uncharacterized protein n=1 Tax=Lymnaea stagnalis TaxID=6523 RepID=A0AAV2IE04_LYMST